MTNYRNQLVQAEGASQEELDRSLLIVNLGMSGLLTYTDPSLFVSPVIFSLISLICLILSFWSSRFAYAEAIKKLDNEETYKVNGYDSITAGLNKLALFCCIVAIISLGVILT